MALQLRRKTHESIVYIDKDSALHILIFVIVIFSGMSLLSCAKANNPKLEKAEAKFHNQFKSGNFKDIYIQSSARLKIMIAEEDLETNLKKAYTSLGEVVDIKKEDILPPIQVDDPNYNRQFSVYVLKGIKGECVEFFTWDASYEVAQLVLYKADCKNDILSKN